MEFVMIGLLVLVLAGQLAGWMLLRRKLRELQQRSARVLVALGAVRESLETLLRREDAAEAVKDLEALLKAAPPPLAQNEEARLSRAVEEGMANILQYAAGKVPGVEVHL